MKLILDVRNHLGVTHDERRKSTHKSQNQDGGFCEKLLLAQLDDKEYPDTEVEDCGRDEEDHGDVDELLPPDLYAHPGHVHLPLRLDNTCRHN